MKQAVDEVSTFAKQEWTSNNKVMQRVQNDMAKYNFSWSCLNLKQFFMIVGLISFLEREKGIYVRTLANELVEAYLQRGTILWNTEPSKAEKKALEVTSNYYNSAKINYRSLYDSLLNRRQVSIGDGKYITVPPLPQVKSKNLLARTLLHKELYLALLLPGHQVHANLIYNGIPVDTETLKVVRYQLLFLDGLGDYLIAKEASAFLFKFRVLEPYSADESFGRKTYQSLRAFLGTNALLLRLALVYNLLIALEDLVVNDLLHKSYVPTLLSGNYAKRTAEVAYEEEFAADYFEQYVGALYLENPEHTKDWLSALFERILCLISDDHRIGKLQKHFRYNYKAWTVDMIGRSI